MRPLRGPAPPPGRPDTAGPVALPGLAQAATITFSEFALNTVITNQYAPLGVIFSPGAVNAPYIALDDAMPTQPILKPDNGLNYAGDFNMTFVGGATNVSFLSGYWDGMYTAVVNVFDLGHSLIISLTNQATSAYTFDLSAYGLIGSVFFSSLGDGNGADIDNLTFNTVPEPASLLLLGTGLVGLARWRRRKI